MKDERRLALRLLLRRGINSIDEKAENEAIAGTVIRRFARGNLSLQQGNVITAEDLDRGRAALRARLRQKRKA